MTSARIAMSSLFARQQQRSVFQKLQLLPFGTTTTTTTTPARRVGVVILSLVGTTTTTTLCEDKNILDVVFPKNSDGSTNWEKASKQLSDNVFWDQLGSVAGQKVQGAIDSGIPTQLSYGFVSGYCSGVALKKVGRAASIVFGLGFMTLQALSYKGYVKVDHVQLQKDFNNMLDLNEDGKVDTEDGKVAYDKVLSVLQFNMPAGGGFAAGFMGGLRSG